MGIHGITNSQVVEKVVKWQKYMDHNRANTLALDLHFDEFFRSLKLKNIEFFKKIHGILRIRFIVFMTS
mgnify:CR=1 FL=1